MRESLYNYCMERNRRDLLDEWVQARNQPLTPETVPPFSHRRVWWKCRTCAYEWQTEIKSRAGSGKSGCPACAGKTVAAGVNDLATTHPLLAEEWHPSRNGTLAPSAVTAGMGKKVWWRCKNGHEWQTSVALRTSGSGCPVCAGRTVLTGYNDLASRYPDIAVQWHPTKNEGITPTQVTAQSNKKVWWRCEIGHEYIAAISSRTQRKTECPYCTNRRVLPGFNDLATRYPNLAAEWHLTKNTRSPSEMSCASIDKVWWVCGKGHEYAATVSARVWQQTGCPICTNRVVLPEENSLAATQPQIASQWHPTKNGTLTPESVSAGSERTVWWKCAKGHEWQAKVSSRSGKNTGCPFCMNRQVLVGYNDLATTHPQLAGQWQSELNETLTPEMFTYGSSRSVWWQCEDGHIWKAPISRRAGVQGSGCPFCNGRLSRTKRLYYESVKKELLQQERK